MREPSELRKRLLREGRALRRISHPLVLDVHDIGETDHGEVYLALEQPSGKTLAEHLTIRTLDERAARVVFEQLVEVIGHMHDKGVVHRAISNDTIFVEEHDGNLETKLTSFTESNVRGEPTLAIGRALYVDPAFTAPELKEGEGDPRCDLFSLGVVLRTMIAREGKLEDGPLAKICTKLLEAEPNARYANARALLDAIRATLPDGA